MRTIACIGDSVVEGEGDELGIGGWVGRLQRKVLAKTEVGEFRVYNLGVGMETSLDLLHRLHGEVSYRSPDIVILQASHGDSRFHRSLDREHDFEIGSAARSRTWFRIFRFLKNYRSLVIGLNPIFMDPSFKKAVPQRAEDLKEYNDFIRKECQKNKIPFLDVKDIFKGKNMKLLYRDGLHPNAKGYDEMFKAVLGKLKDLNYL